MWLSGCLHSSGHQSSLGRSSQTVCTHTQPTITSQWVYGRSVGWCRWMCVYMGWSCGVPPKGGVCEWIVLLYCVSVLAVLLDALCGCVWRDVCCCSSVSSLCLCSCNVNTHPLSSGHLRHRHVSCCRRVSVLHKRGGSGEQQEFAGSWVTVGV